MRMGVGDLVSGRDAEREISREVFSGLQAHVAQPERGKREMGMGAMPMKSR